MCKRKENKTEKLIMKVLTNGVYYQDIRYKKERTFLDKNEPERRKKERIIVDLDRQCFTLIELHTDSHFESGYQVADLKFDNCGKDWGVLD